MGNTKLKERLMSANGTTTALATVTENSSNFVALENNALDIIRENLKNQPLSVSLFDIVKSPSGGSTVFSVPGISSEESEKSLTGIILDYITPRAYWNTPDPVESTLPTCSSDNSIVSMARHVRLVSSTTAAQGTAIRQPKPARNPWCCTFSVKTA